MAIYQTNFAEYEVKESSVKFNDAAESSFNKLGCVGKLDEELECKVVQKKCEGIVAKTRTIGTGNGTLTLSLHIRYDLYVKAFGMESTDLKDGVVAYGRNSRHKEFTYVAKVLDEDGLEKMIAYPRCIMASAPKGSIENGVEEIAEIEIEISIMPDDFGNGKYEMVVTNDVDETLKSTWLTAFTPALVRKSSV